MATISIHQKLVLVTYSSKSRPWHLLFSSPMFVFAVGACAFRLSNGIACIAHYRRTICPCSLPYFGKPKINSHTDVSVLVLFSVHQHVWEWARPRLARCSCTLDNLSFDKLCPKAANRQSPSRDTLCRCKCKFFWQSRGSQGMDIAIYMHHC